MSTFLKKYSPLLIAILLNLAALGIFLAMLWLRSNVAFKISQLATDKATWEGRSRQLTELRSLVEKTADDRQEIRQHFVNQDSLPQFIEAVEQLAAKNSVSLQLGSIKMVNSPAPALRFEVRTSGPKNQVLNFIEQLEAMPYRLIVRSATLSLGTDEKTKESWTSIFSLDLLSYLATDTSQDQGNAH